jgi:DNA repair photolyase
MPLAATPPAPGLVGIGRLAALAPSIDHRNDVDYRALPCRSCVNDQPNRRMPFRWTINPYRGCELGCPYCYARYTHEYLEHHDRLDFERTVYVKQDLAAHFARELRSGRVRRDRIAIGTATDPYQPAERRFGVTRSLLEVAAEHRGLSLSITTKSDLVLRDIDLLRRIAARSRLRVNVTVTTTDRDLARALEPRAPTPEKRLAAVRGLRDAGIAVGVFAAPVLPFVTDGEERLDALFGAVAAARGYWVCAHPLFLRPTAARRYVPFIRERFPEASRRFASLYGPDGNAPERYRRALQALVEALRRRHGLEGGPDDARDEPARERGERQGLLGFQIS